MDWSFALVWVSEEELEEWGKVGGNWLSFVIKEKRERYWFIIVSVRVWEECQGTGWREGRSVESLFVVEESEGERDELTSILVRYPRHNFATMSEYLSLPNNIIRREILWSKIFVDAPLQCISEIICWLYIFLQTLATCAHTQCSNDYFADNILRYKFNCKYNEDFMSGKIFSSLQ